MSRAFRREPLAFQLKLNAHATHARRLRCINMDAHAGHLKWTRSAAICAALTGFP
jgi:hypothetical protein